MLGNETERLFMQNQSSEGLFKKGFMRNFPELTIKHLCRNLFFDKVKLRRSLESLKQVFFVKFAKFVGTAFSDYSSINGNEGRIGKQNRNYITKDSPSEKTSFRNSRSQTSN